MDLGEKNRYIIELVSTNEYKLIWIPDLVSLNYGSAVTQNLDRYSTIQFDIRLGL